MIEINGKKINNVFEAKTEIIKLMKDCCDENKTTSEKDLCKQNLIDFLQKCSIDTDLKREYEEISENLKNNRQTNYRYCGSTHSYHYNYFINSDGIMILVHSEKSLNINAKKQDIYKNNAGIIDNEFVLELENGHIKNVPKEVENDITLALVANIYNFMREAGWLDDDQSYILAENLKSDNEDKLEIHHINNRPDDNRVDNLIWLPCSIHCQSHKYSKIYTFELTIEEYEKVDAFIKVMRKKK